MKIEVPDALPNNVTKMRIRNRKDQESVISIAPRPGACSHLRAMVDEDLMQLECADCGVTLNPIEFLKKLAHRETMWGWQYTRLQEARKEQEARSRCRCTHCGQWTQVRRVGKRELKRILSPGVVK